MSEIPVRGVAFAVTAMAFVGSSAAVSGTLTTAPLCTAQAVRYTVAAVILLALARFCHVPVQRPRGAEWLWLTGVSASGLVLFNIAVVRGVAHAQPAMIAVAVACVPVLLGVLGPLLQGQRPRSRVVLAAVVVTVGAVLVEGAGHADVTGAAWAALTLVCEAGFTLLAVPVLGRHGAWGVSVHSTWMGAVIFGVLGLAAEGPSAAARLTAPDLLAVSYLALVVTVTAFLLWYTAVSALGPARAGLITGIAPVSAALSGLALGTRTPNLPMWLGIAILAAGLAVGLRPHAPRPGADQLPVLARAKKPRQWQHRPRLPVSPPIQPPDPAPPRAAEPRTSRCAPASLPCPPGSVHGRAVAVIQLQPVVRLLPRLGQDPPPRSRLQVVPQRHDQRELRPCDVGRRRRGHRPALQRVQDLRLAGGRRHIAYRRPVPDALRVPGHVRVRPSVSEPGPGRPADRGHHQRAEPHVPARPVPLIEQPLEALPVAVKQDPHRRYVLVADHHRAALPPITRASCANPMTCLHSSPVDHDRY